MVVEQAGCYFHDVIDMRVRPRVTRFLEPIGRSLSRIGMTATAMTVLGLVVVICGAVFIAMDRLAIGGAIVLAGSILDGLDGAVARASNSTSDRGAFLDAAFDRLGEIASFSALAVASAGQPRVLLLIVLGLGGALLVPYMRARAEAEGLDGRGGLMGRAERIILFCVGLILGQVEPMLWVFVVLVWFTAVSRFWRSYRSIP
ncbi:MAG: CDP-alcohol phosphatidyltransferase family protein [Acidimicrobiales bacterium]|jgi:CDP-diacylglycerol--glycerol-3-phosphate 3-phosphatidyltransferase|nr:CDP-alcohol phosphatidyltransferase family protein [Acidimicrobiales bacterium]HLV91324.1 CDP-alcohol phosphatidyltransferase family protein [Acidimicrobiia bacterium]